MKGLAVLRSISLYFAIEHLGFGVIPITAAGLPVFIIRIYINDVGQSTSNTRQF